MKDFQKLVLVDGSGYIFRAYYALPNMNRSDGTPVNAVFGFTNMLLKLLEDVQKDYGGNIAVAVIFDAARKTFRNQIFTVGSYFIFYHRMYKLFRFWNDFSTSI